MWDPPGPGIEPMSLALQGRFLTSGPPGKPLDLFLFCFNFLFCSGVELIKKVMMVSGKQQRDSAMHMHGEEWQ